MEIRLARPEDALAVARVHVRAWQVGYRGLLPDAYLDSLRPEDRAARYTFGDPDPSRPLTVVAIDGETLRGFATIGRTRDADAVGAGELMALHVDPDSWQRGIGQALIADARARLSRGGYTEAILWVLAGNVRADRFYVADGWRADGTIRQDEVWGITVTESRYRRALP